MKTAGNSYARSGSTQALVRTSDSTSKATIKAQREPASDDAVKRHAVIAEAAYLLAEQRHFEAGHDVEDWLAAEIALNQTRAAGVARTS